MEFSTRIAMIRFDYDTLTIFLRTIDTWSFQGQVFKEEINDTSFVNRTEELTRLSNLLASKPEVIDYVTNYFWA